MFLSKLPSLIPLFIISFPPCPLMSSSKELFGYGAHSFVHQDTKCSIPFWCQRALAFPLLWLLYHTWRQCWTINSRPIIFNTEHVIKSAASLPLPPLLTQLPLTHHTTSDVLEICPLSSYRKTSLHRSCLITVCELQPIASYQINCQLPRAFRHVIHQIILCPCRWNLPHISPQFPHISLPFNLLNIPSVLFSLAYSKRFPSSSICHLTCVHLAPASCSLHALSSWRHERMHHIK